MRRIIFLLLMVSALPTWAGRLEEAKALMDRGQPRQAADLLIAAAGRKPATADELMLITAALRHAGDYKEAVAWGKLAIAAAPDRSEAHLEYARAVRLKMQKVNKVSAMFSVGTYKSELRRALELDPRNIEAHQEEIGFLIYAPGIAGGDKQAAGRRIEELKGLDRRAGMWMETDLLRETGDTAGLIATYTEMLEANEDDQQVREALAYALQADGRYREADPHFVVLLASGEARRALGARYQLARSRVLGGYESDRAVEHLRGYIEQLGADRRGLPSASNAYWRLGLAYEQLQRIEEARQALERALELDGDNKEARAALRKLPRG